MDDSDLIRYSRQILLSSFDIDGQLILDDSSIAIIGLGGLGALAARLLVGCGVGHVLLIDNDTVNISNLHRQILYDESDLNQPKVTAAANKLKKVNANTDIKTIYESLENVEHRHFEGIDLIFDCSDNVATRYHINELSLKLRLPYVYGAAIRFEGVIAVFDPNDECSPCLKCWLGDYDQQQEETCQQTGIFPSIVNTIASMQVTEGLKYVLKIGRSSMGKLTFYDGLSNDWQTINISKHKQCLCQTPSKV